MSEELTAKEVLQIVAEICKNSHCKICKLNFHGEALCRFEIAEHADEVVEICKKWKSEHPPIETEWVHVCRIIEDTGSSKRFVYEEEIEEDDILPFETYDKMAEEVLKKYIKSHEGDFFVVVERLCRKVVR